jgi:hypothetical protein
VLAPTRAPASTGNWPAGSAHPCAAPGGTPPVHAGVDEARTCGEAAQGRPGCVPRLMGENAPFGPPPASTSMGWCARGAREGVANR